MIKIIQARPESKRITKQNFRPRSMHINREQALVSFNKGKQFQNKQQYLIALQHYQEAITYNPDYYQAYSNMGVCQRALFKFLKALQYYLHALSLKYDDLITHYNIGNTYRIIGDNDKALQHYKLVIQLCQKNGNKVNSLLLNSHINLGVCYQNTGYHLEAIECYEQAHVLVPDDQGPIYNQAVCLIQLMKKKNIAQFTDLKEQRKNKCRMLLEKVIELNPKNIQAEIKLIELGYFESTDKSLLLKAIQDYKALQQKLNFGENKDQIEQKIARCSQLLQKDVKEQKKKEQQFKRSIEISKNKKSQKSQDLESLKSKQSVQIIEKVKNTEEIKKERGQVRYTPDINQNSTNKNVQQNKTDKWVKSQQKQLQKPAFHQQKLLSFCDKDQYDAAWLHLNGLAEYEQQNEWKVMLYCRQAQISSEQEREKYLQIGLNIYTNKLTKKSNKFSLEVQKSIAYLLTACGRTQQAISYYESIQQNYEKQKSPNTADLLELYQGLGINYQAQGIRNKAIEHYKKSLQLQPQNLALRYNLGLCLKQNKQYKQAYEILKSFLTKLLENEQNTKQNLQLYEIDCMIHMSSCLENKQQLKQQQLTMNKINKFTHNQPIILLKHLDQITVLNFYLSCADNLQSAISQHESVDLQNIKRQTQTLLQIYSNLLQFEKCPDRNAIIINCGNIFYQEQEYLNALTYYRQLELETNLISNNLALTYLHLYEHKDVLNCIENAILQDNSNFIYQINYLIITWVYTATQNDSQDNQNNNNQLFKMYPCKCDKYFYLRLNYALSLIYKLTIQLTNKNDISEEVDNLLSKLIKVNDQQFVWTDFNKKNIHYFMEQKLIEHCKVKHNQNVKDKLEYYNKDIIEMVLNSQKSYDNLIQYLKKVEQITYTANLNANIQFLICFYFLFKLPKSQSNIHQVKNSIDSIQKKILHNIPLYSLWNDNQNEMNQYQHPILVYKLKQDMLVEPIQLINCLQQWQASVQDRISCSLNLIQSIYYGMQKVHPSLSLKIKYHIPHSTNVNDDDYIRTVVLLNQLLEGTAMQYLPTFDTWESLNEGKNNAMKEYYSSLQKYVDANASKQDKTLKMQIKCPIITVYAYHSSANDTQLFVNQLNNQCKGIAIQVQNSSNKIHIILNHLILLECRWNEQQVGMQFIQNMLKYPQGSHAYCILAIDEELKAFIPYLNNGKNNNDTKYNDNNMSQKNMQNSENIRNLHLLFGEQKLNQQPKQI